MFVAPRPGFQYRHTQSRQLVPTDGFEADPTDIDIDRALACGDLVEVETKPRGRKPAAQASES